MLPITLLSSPKEKNEPHEDGGLFLASFLSIFCHINKDIYIYSPQTRFLENQTTYCCCVALGVLPKPRVLQCHEVTQESMISKGHVF